MTWNKNDYRPAEDTYVLAWLTHSNSPHVFKTLSNDALVSVYKHKGTGNYVTTWSNVLFWVSIPTPPVFKDGE